MEDLEKMKSFPRNEREACAFLYMKSQDLSGKSPIEVYEMYLEAYYEISKEHNRRHHNGWFTTKKEEVRRSL